MQSSNCFGYLVMTCQTGALAGFACAASTVPEAAALLACELEVDVERDHHEHDAEPERDPPPPREQGLFREDGAEDQECDVRKQHAAWSTHRRDTAVKALLVLRCGLDSHQHDTALLTADRDALKQTQHDERDRGRRTSQRVAREESYGDGGDSHHQQRDDECLFAAIPVAEVAENDPAEGSCEEADTERREGEQQPDHRITVREEELWEDQRRCETVDEEVEVLDTSGEAGDSGDAKGGIRRRGRRNPTGILCVGHRCSVPCHWTACPNVSPGLLMGAAKCGSNLTIYNIKYLLY
jgi:hypothetical protein